MAELILWHVEMFVIVLSLSYICVQRNTYLHRKDKNTAASHLGYTSVSWEWRDSLLPDQRRAFDLGWSAVPRLHRKEESCWEEVVFLASMNDALSVRTDMGDPALICRRIECRWWGCEPTRLTSEVWLFQLQKSDSSDSFKEPSWIGFLTGH